ncbi:amidohydrolase [Roseivirga pacifica]|uniref:amidohydrolase n=1 Tax=Roseivirga pacifica TaxID=1267423 RepID=UPI002095A943|nr:amidohydrolase [Roseivirga pacifica]MCO6357971.1 amidohydrolase family protein [Roseivirga pacifica]MCO6366410.1 amidohydrolase family protein [Roseivirga pacifica]MCO6370895.1 amidohydrolase family protein [Roseivirga pacifica]MCO6373703.1 amidohydrolase family protein [Roseivirga pacifica]MCO6380684.1 amidohydrolase family protein [Roseivirga pacifica]
MKKLYTLLALFCFIGTAWAQTPKGDVLIKNGTVLTVTNGTLENTDVLVRDGKITKIGKGIRTPRGVQEIDATGKFVMPGIIDAHSHIAGSAINEGTSQVTAEVSMEDVVDPMDVSIYRALAGGVTSIHLMHGSANVIGGQNETMKLRYGSTNPDDLRFEGAPRTIKFALGENPTRGGRARGIQPQSRMGVEMMLRNSFTQAQEYKKKWDAYNANKSARKVAPEYDLRMETLVDILEGEVWVNCHSYRADEIYMLLKVFSDFGIDRINFQHANEAYKVAPELAAFGATASVFADWWAYKLEVYYSTAYNAAILTENGVLTSINSDSGELIRHLFHEAAKTQKYGDLSDDEALALVTLNPAKQLGIDNRVGSLEEGKDADIAIFEGHPLSVYAIPMMTFVDGVKYFDRENDKADQRIYINPESNIEEVTIFDRHDMHRCMEGALSFEELFSTSKR